MAQNIKGAESGIHSIKQWFGQFPTFKKNPNSKPEIISQFNDLAAHLQLKDRASRDRHFKSLLTVVVSGKTAYPKSSGCREVAAVFLAKFPKFEHNLDNSLDRELRRLASHAKYPEWKKSARIVGRVQGRMRSS